MLALQSRLLLRATVLASHQAASAEDNDRPKATASVALMLQALGPHLEGPLGSLLGTDLLAELAGALVPLLPPLPRPLSSSSSNGIPGSVSFLSLTEEWISAFCSSLVSGSFMSTDGPNRSSSSGSGARGNGLGGLSCADLTSAITFVQRAEARLVPEAGGPRRNTSAAARTAVEAFFSSAAAAASALIRPPPAAAPPAPHSGVTLQQPQGRDLKPLEFLDMLEVVLLRGGRGVSGHDDLALLAEALASSHVVQVLATMGPKQLPPCKR